MVQLLYDNERSGGIVVVTFCKPRWRRRITDGWTRHKITVTEVGT